jgi:hypothetical protein
MAVAVMPLLVFLLAVFIPSGGANAGTCRVYSDGPDSVESCEDGSFTVTDRHGHVRQYGVPNGGFERFPGQGEQPVYRRGDERK